MASPPTTPSRFTHSHDGSEYNYSPSSHTRRLSRSSLPGDHEGDSMAFNTSGIGMPGSNGAGNGLGNLADELADALSDGEDEYYEDSAAPDVTVDEIEGEAAPRPEAGRDSGVDVTSPMERKHNKHLSITVPQTNGKGGHRRTDSHYDGSEYGSDSDLDSPGMPSSLVAKIDAVESLARRGTENNGGPTDGVFQRVTASLRDLTSQSNVEGHTSRLITAHTALATHLNHQTRQLHNLTFPLLNPLAAPPDAETIDSLLPELTALQEMLPRPSQTAFGGIVSLQNLTNDLVATLSLISDRLQESRQITTTATRRLRTAKELVAELKTDEDLRDEGERWLTKGNWNEKLEKRACASACGDIIGGFEEVCDGWRARLAQAEVTQA
ncbi:unnamed protein product [Discula destructiva]